MGKLDAIRRLPLFISLRVSLKALDLALLLGGILQAWQTSCPVRPTLARAAVCVCLPSVAVVALFAMLPIFVVNWV